MTAMHLAIRAKNRKRFEILRFVGESTAQVRPVGVQKFSQKILGFSIWAEHPAGVLVLAPCASRPYQNTSGVNS